MTPEYVMALAHQAMIVSLSLAGPPLLIALIVGLLIAMFQAATQINESTLVFIPKLLAVLITLVIAGPWMLGVMLDFMRKLFTSLAGIAG
ncbi:flagellar biosynthesis protein FliQ [Burkholderia sp. L27(2015)]|jgi:flagellar biosynthetic protein FliQ|uniref:flagellar biosynthesis protein FliQ n=1 Tax=Burkholderia sp. L27(2015) TaxID=1641858 RepID=UPI00131AE395|nr:flagellar biosynthesis protein FliQ [Burkholderia sp. L27(2015)]